MRERWRAGIFRGANGRPMRQINPDDVHDVIAASVRDGMIEGTDAIIDKLEKRYASQVSMMMTAGLVSAACVVILTILAISKEV